VWGGFLLWFKPFFYFFFFFFFFGLIVLSRFFFFFFCADWGLIWLQLNPIHNCCSLMLLDCWLCLVTEVGLFICVQNQKKISQVRKNDSLFVVSCKPMLFFC